jgi:hypothetical protein
MNYQKMCDALMNYQLDQKRASNYQLYTFCLLLPVKPVNMDGICRFWTLILIKRQKCPQLIKKKIGLLIWFKFINKNIKTNIYIYLKKKGWRGTPPEVGLATPSALPIFFSFFLKLRAFRSFLKLSEGI